MNRLCVSIILGILLLVSCAGKPNNRARPLQETPDIIGTKLSYTIIDHKNLSSGKDIPEWVDLWLNAGVRGVETLDAFKDRYAFVHTSEGRNFNALNLWNEGFSPELDFPRLAAARIDRRFSRGVFNPSDEYGAFYEALIRSVSDAQWTGAKREDDFWILKKILPAEDGTENEGAAEIWEFFILVTVEKPLFASRLDEIFRIVNPDPAPSKSQMAAVNLVKSHFFEGF